jgi:NAD(P)-dependent dehydrogenase (short-subunit alcohol dehydrogenase family)
MDNLQGRNALLTGASGGLGNYIALALANAGVNLSLVAFPGAGLEELRDKVKALGVRAAAFPLDLRTDDGIAAALAETRREFKTIDILINNAGIEFTSAYHDLPPETIEDILSVNLHAPMLLTRGVLPEMLQRRSGHIVNISSLAGKAGPGYQEPYAATKAGLIGFTFSLRATYRGSGVSASVISPGFVEAGIYARLKERTGQAAPALLGTSPPEPVGKAVVRAIQKDLPDVIINPYPVRPLFALTALLPSLGEWMTTSLGVHRFFGRIAEAQKRGTS